MVFGLPATSEPVQVWFEQPLTVIVPPTVPADTGVFGVIVIAPVVGPVMEKVAEKPVPVVGSGVRMKTEPPLTLTVTVWGVGVAPPAVAEKVTDVVETEYEGPPPPPPPPPPPQAESNPTVTSDAATKRARMPAAMNIMEPPLMARAVGDAADDQHE
jgi:hypothetical protein